MKLIIVFFIFSFLNAMEPDIENVLTVNVPTHHRRSSVIILDTTDEDYICDMALTFFSENGTQTGRLSNYIRRHVRAALDSPSEKERCDIRALRSLPSESGHDEYLMRYLQSLVIKATADALQSIEEEADKKVSKTRATTYAVISSTVTGLLAIGATLLVHFTDGNCN